MTILDFTLTGSRNECTADPLVQGRILPGKAERGDRVGRALGAVRGTQQNEDEYGITTLVGVPGENLRNSVNAGVVTLIPPANSAGGDIKFRSTTYDFAGGRTTGLQFGSVFAHHQAGFH